MPRRREVPKREILPDPKHGSELLTRFINVLMKSGKKSVAEKIVYGALDQITEKLTARLKELDAERSGDNDDGSTGTSGGNAGQDVSIRIFDRALDNVRPSVEVRSRRVGGATYQIPVEVPAKRRTALAMRWVVSAARARSEKGMMARLAGELTDAFEGRGTAVKKREDTHRMAKANQAFAHFRWN